VKNGADIVELGVPFTDPMADGPTIQASSQRALENGVAIDDILQMVRELRTETDVPIVLFSYLNPLFRYGFDRLAAAAAEAGIDGVLVTDAVDHEAAEISSVLQGKGLDPDIADRAYNDDERLEKIAARSSGFL
jgi:tryptophan synthase alpha chain